MSSLREVAARSGRVEPGDYAQTGVVQTTARDRNWSAFVTFAPWAYDATAWSESSQALIELSDEARSIAVR